MAERIEFGSKALADAWRRRAREQGYLCPADDARLKTVMLRSDTPEAFVEEAHRAADEDRAERERGPGQVELTEHEREQIDFSKGHASVPHAQAVKGIATAEGVDDWLSYYDPTLTVDEHRQVMARAATEGGGDRLDAEESATSKAGRAAAMAQAGQCDHARGHCEHGDADACEFLSEHCGLTAEEVAEIMDETTADSELGELPGEAYGALSKLWAQYKAGVADAKEAAAGINEVRAQYGQDPIAFKQLGGRRITKESLAP